MQPFLMVVEAAEVLEAGVVAEDAAVVEVLVKAPVEDEVPQALYPTMEDSVNHLRQE